MIEKLSVPKFLNFISIIFLGFQIGLSQDEPVRLKLNEQLERKILGGEKQVFRILLAENEYARISVEQSGVDLAIRFVGADGKLLIRFDGNIRTSGTETVEYAAVTASDFTIEVEPKLKTAPSAAYKIIWDEQRAATEKDFSWQEARSLSSKAAILGNEGKYAEGLALAERSLQIRERIFGIENERTALAINLVGVLNLDLGNETKAEEYFAESLSILEKLKDADVLKTADVINNVAGNFGDKGDFAEAEKLLFRALEIRRKELGENHNTVASNYNNLGNFYRKRGDYVKAQEMIEKSLEIRERLFGTENVDYTFTLGNLALLYYYRGDFPLAQKMFEQILAVREKKLSPDHSLTGDALGNLGRVFADAGDLNKAEPIFLRAIANYEKNYGQESIRILPPISYLAKLYKITGELDKAEALYQRILKIGEKNYKEDSVEFLEYLKNVGDFYIVKGNFEKAEFYLKIALERSEKLLGKKHFRVGQACSSLANLYFTKGDAARAVEFQECANRLAEKSISQNIAVGTEFQKLAYLKLSAEDLNRTLNLQAVLPENKVALEQAVTSVLQKKGRVLDATTGSFSELRRRFDTQDQTLLQKLNDTFAALAEYSLNKPSAISVAEYQKRLLALQEQKSKIETEISRRSAGFYQTSAPISLESVKAAIPPDAALVEFAIYHPQKTEKSEPRYVAFVVHQIGETRAQDIGEVRRIDALINEFRASLRDAKSGNVRQVARELDAKLMQPVRVLAGDARHLLISPDGALNLIPFEALIDEKESFLIENYLFSYLTSGRDLLRMEAERTSKNKSLIIANPLFGGQAVETTATRKTSRTATRSLLETYFAPLGGTSQEARNIQNLFPDWTVLSGTAATETALKKTIAPRILHIATHGYFLENETKIENPLLRSGIALAGANKRDSGAGKDDGILTALEASGLNLWGTKLVVLSACDTGLGEVKNGEGVYGLRRAFTLAGTETLLMSLWQVSDYATRELMTEYYKNIKAGMKRGASLRQVQLAMLRKPNRQHPFFWAAFIQSGEWANLDGKR